MNLCFELLDEPVIHGRGEEPALDGLTFARLLEHVAAVGGVLRAVEVAAGTPVGIMIGDDHRWCVATLAAARLGAVVTTGEAPVGFDEEATLRWHDNELDWEGVLRAGRTDPAPAVELTPTASYDGTRRVADLADSATRLAFPVSSADLRRVLS